MFGIFQSHNPVSRAKQELKETQLQHMDQVKAYEYHEAMAKMLALRINRLEIYIEVNGEKEFTSLPGVDK